VGFKIFFSQKTIAVKQAKNFFLSNAADNNLSITCRRAYNALYSVLAQIAPFLINSIPVVAHMISIIIVKEPLS
ncbi:hypothetical protein ACH5RR_013351, partial [Cinchona calisaya]